MKNLFWAHIFPVAAVLVVTAWALIVSFVMGFIKEQARRVMAKLADLTASVQALTDAVNKFLAAQTPSVPEAQLDGVKASVDVLTAQVTAATPQP